MPKMRQNATADPLGELKRSPDPLAAMRGLLLRGGEGSRGRGRDGKGKERKGGEKGSEGKGETGEMRRGREVSGGKRRGR